MPQVPQDWLHIALLPLSPLFRLIHSYSSDSFTPTPHALQKPIPLRQAIKRIIRLPHRSYESTHRVCLILSRIAPVLVDLADAQLDGGVIG